MYVVSRILLLAWFVAAQSIVWTDCAEGVLCPDKAGCADDCAAGGCCPGEESLCAHLEPQADVDRPEAAPPADVAVPVALVEVAAPDPDPSPSLPRPDVPPRLRPRPLHLQLSLLLV